MKLALSIPVSEARNPIKGGRDWGCKELDVDMHSQPNQQLKKEKTRKKKRDGECGGEGIGLI